MAATQTIGYNLQIILVNQRVGHEKGSVDLSLDRLIVLCLCDFYMFFLACVMILLFLSHTAVYLFVSDPFLEVLLS